MRIFARDKSIVMRKVEFEPLFLTEAADIFTIRVDEGVSEFNKFLVLFKDIEDPFLKDDFNKIIAAINKILQNGALESYFRIEGKMSDRICAIPLLIIPRDKSKHGTLRLYCIRMSDSLLIIGGGGLKVTDTYQEDETLVRHVSTLQMIDSRLADVEKSGLDLHKELFNIVIDID